MSVISEIYSVFTSVPAIVKVLAVFTAAVLLGRLKIHLGIALIMGGVALNFWAGLAPVDVFISLAKSFADPVTWLFVVIMILVLEVGRYFTDAENSSEIVAAVRRWSGRHGATWALVSMPAIMGLMPMPGGAILSAPFVEQTGGKAVNSPAWKTAVNYWFRHIWEYWWPLYPGIIVGMVLFGMIPSWKFILFQSVFTVVAVAVGYIFLVRPHVAALAGYGGEYAGSARRAAMLFLPLGVVLVSATLLPSLFLRFAPTEDRHLVQLVKMFAMLAGLTVAAAMIVVDDFRAGKKKFEPVIFSWKTLNIQLSLVGVLVFSGMVESSGLLPAASRDLAESGIPLTLIVVMLPLLAGLIMGIAVGFVGASFPIIVSLMIAAGDGASPVATLALAYCSGYMGMMLSPVHLCLLVTSDYFSAKLSAVYRAIIPCVAAVFLFAVLYYVILSLAGL